MRITHAKVYQFDGTFKEAELNIQGDRIVEHAEGAQEKIDAFGLFAVPAAINFRYTVDPTGPLAHSENYGIDKVGKEQMDAGIAAYVAATRLPKEHVEKVAKVVNNWNSVEAERHPECANLVGLMLDRPLQHIKCAKPSEQSWKELALDDAKEFTSLETSSRNLLKVIMVNPNTEGIEEYIKAVRGDACVALADVNPDFATAEKAIKAGATIVTKSWKNKFEETKPQSSVVDALAQNGQVNLELVASEKTAPRKDVQAVFARFQGRIVLTSWDNNVFAAARRAIEMGVPASIAIDAVTKKPAELLGIERDYGTIEIGKLANIVLVNEKYQIKHIIHNGTLLV